MSKLHDLITKLCPGGVQYKKLGEIAVIKKGIQLNKSMLLDDGKYPVLNGGKNYSGYWNEYNFDGDRIAISQGGASAGFVTWMEKPFWAGAHCYVIDSSKESELRYLFHVVKSHELDYMKAQYGAGIPSLSLKTLSQTEVPLPPLLVQSEIVRILDSFTELEAELEAELAGRKEQYEYYRDHLLDKKNLERMDGKPVEEKKLGDFSSYIRGITYNKGQETRHDGWKVLRANNIDLTTGNLVLDDIKTVSSTVKVPETKILKSNDILICAGSGSKEHVGKVSFINHDLSFTFGGFMGVIRTNSNDISSRFLYYILKSNIFRRYLSSELNGTTINNLNSRIVNNFELPVPSLATQERIVDILDRFDALTTSLTDGIPAEIAMRREQYEYYRSRLLDFPRLPEYSDSDGE